MLKNIFRDIFHWNNNGNITTTKNKNNNLVTNSPSNKIESNINLINPNLELVIKNINNSNWKYIKAANEIKECNCCMNKLKETYKNIGQNPEKLYNYDISKWIYNIYNRVPSINHIACSIHEKTMNDAYTEYHRWIMNINIINNFKKGE